MKKTITFIALFTIMAATSNAQSASEMRNTVANVAPSIPTLAQYSGSGQAWRSGKNTYTMESREKVQAWIKAYPKEALDFKTSMLPYLSKTDVTKLSKEDADEYYSLKAIWLAVAQSPELSAISRSSAAPTK